VAAFLLVVAASALIPAPTKAAGVERAPRMPAWRERSVRA
jgi:hypothetical protein